MTRKRAYLFVVALVVASLTPVAGAHWDWAGNGADCGNTAFDENDAVLPGPADTCNVAGRVVGTVGPTVVDPQGEDLSVGAIGLCDLELSGPDTQWTSSQEAEVDEQPNPLAPTAVPDNTWDDGGYGVACHVGSYVLDDFNTRGCEGEARATTIALGVFVAATCDAGTTTTASSLPPSGLVTAGVCLANEVLSGNLGFASCVDPLTASGSSFASCANDGQADASNTGYATQTLGPAIPSVTCDVTTDPDGSVPAIFVFAPVVDATGNTGQPTTHVWGT